MIMNNPRFAAYLESASAAMRAGFYTMSAKKDANTCVSRAYEMFKDVIMDAEGFDFDNDYASLPYELRHVKDEKFLAVASKVGFADAAETLKTLKGLREEIAAAPVLKKVKEVKTVADPSKGERLQYRGICQVCGHEQAIVNGKMAKHGYTVKFGFFNGVCAGEHFAPIQHSTEEAERIIAKCSEEAGKSDEAADKMQAGKIHPLYVKRGFGKNEEQIKFEEAEIWEQRRAREAMIWNLRSEARQYRAHGDMLIRLVAEYSGKELRAVVVC